MRIWIILLFMMNQNFNYEEKFLNDKELLSVINCGEHHNINIEEIKNKNVEIIFTHSVISSGKTYITDLICKTSNDFYLYLSKTTMEDKCLLKIYYKQDKKNFVDLLIKSFKK